MKKVFLSIGMLLVISTLTSELIINLRPAAPLTPVRQKHMPKMQAVDPMMHVSLAPMKPMYAYSLIPGGVKTATEFELKVMTDPVLMNLFRGCDLNTLHYDRLPMTMSVYVSFRRGNKILWNKRPIVVKQNEPLITGCGRTVLMRCGNLIMFHPQEPSVDLPDGILDTPISPSTIVPPVAGTSGVVTSMEVFPSEPTSPVGKTYGVGGGTSIGGIGVPSGGGSYPPPTAVSESSTAGMIIGGLLLGLVIWVIQRLREMKSKHDLKRWVQDFKDETGSVLLLEILICLIVLEALFILSAPTTAKILAARDQMQAASAMKQITNTEMYFASLFQSGYVAPIYLTGSSFPRTCDNPTLGLPGAIANGSVNYTFTYYPGNTPVSAPAPGCSINSNGTTTFSILAAPRTAGINHRTFFSDSTGIVRYSDTSTANASSPIWSGN